MNFLEKDLEQIIYDSPQNEIHDRGLWHFYHDFVLRQLDLGSYGIADLVGIRYYRCGKEKSVHITVYELKQDKVSVSTLLQAAKYYKGIQVFLHRTYNLSDFSMHFSIVLIGKTIETKGEFVFLLDLMQNISVYTYDYKFDGIRFKKEGGYFLNNATFPNSLIEEVQETMYALMRINVNKDKTTSDLPF